MNHNPKSVNYSTVTMAKKVMPQGEKKRKTEMEIYPHTRVKQYTPTSHKGQVSLL
jgi:hypothetical protein